MSEAVLQSLFDLTPEEKGLVQKTFGRVDTQAIIDGFYQKFTVHDVTAPFFRNQDIDRLKKNQVAHWARLVQEGASPAVLEKTRVIGSIHEKIGVTPEIYLAGYAFVFEELLDQAIASLGFQGAKKRKAVIGAYARLLMMDIASSLSAYLERSNDTTVQGKLQEAAENVIQDTVDVSMTMNRVFIDALKTNQIATEVDHQVNSISAAIEEMSATVGTITHNTAQAQEYAGNASLSASQGRDVSDQAMRNMTTIKDAVAETSCKASNLSESSKRIEQIVGKIQDIADQTNLLALNATIEAARAGDAGKGFAVVANEVKSLSNETAQATKEISDIIGELIGSIQEIVASMQQVDEAVESGQTVTESVKQRMDEIEDHANQVRLSMDEISRALGEQSLATQEISAASGKILDSSGRNKEMSDHSIERGRASGQLVANMITNVSGIGLMNSRIILSLAKSDHIIWVRKMADMLLGGAGLKQEELSDHTQCRLGKWYFSTGKEEFGDTAAYQALSEPHIRIHKLGKEAHALYERHEYDRALEKLDDMEKTSDVIIKLLGELGEIAKTGS